MSENATREQILIVDDEEVNRTILSLMFDADYDIVEAANGMEAIEAVEKNNDIALILLDVIMPVMDGFGVLDYMKEKALLEKIPVILITSMTPQESEEKAYEYGIADVMHKPFESAIIKRRANNIIELYQSKKNLEIKLKEQEVTIREQEKAIRDNNEFMIDALGSVVEFRSIETGDHVKRIKYLTRILLKYLAKYFPKYGVTPTQIDQIARASALHDIGKIGIPDSILLKPGKLTTEEFEVMKRFWNPLSLPIRTTFISIVTKYAVIITRELTAEDILTICRETKFRSARRSYLLQMCMRRLSAKGYIKAHTAMMRHIR